MDPGESNKQKNEGYTEAGPGCSKITMTFNFQVYFMHKQSMLFAAK